MKKFNIKLIRSLIGCTKTQVDTAKALGLKKINDVKSFNDSPQFRGQVRKIQHLITIEKAN